MYFAEQECGEAVHKALHLSDSWEFFSVNIDDTETRVDILCVSVFMWYC